LQKSQEVPKIFFKNGTLGGAFYETLSRKKSLAGRTLAMSDIEGQIYN
jgi:hypothetical protein